MKSLTLPVNPAHLTCIIDSQSQQKIKGSLVEDERVQFFLEQTRAILRKLNKIK